MQDFPKTSNTSNCENAALAAVLKIGHIKRRLIRLFELFAYPIVRVSKIWRDKTLPEIDAVRSILVMEYWQLGDALIILPFLRNLRLQFPLAKISMLASAPVKSVLQDQDVADEWIPIRVPWAETHSRISKYNPFSSLWIQLSRTLATLRRKQFDLALSGGMDIRNNCLLWLTGARRRVSYGFPGGAFFLTDSVVPDPVRPHRAEIWLRLLEYLGKPVSDPSARFRVRDSQTAFAGSFLSQLGISEQDIVVGVHPGARIPIRRWGDENFVTVGRILASKFNIQLLWFLGPGDTPPTSCAALFHFVKLPFSEFTPVLARCNLLICNDSGPMHVADALGVPVVAIFGPQQPAWYGPRNKASRVVYRPEFWCRPCSDYCKFDQPYCLRTITPDAVIRSASDAVQEIFSSKGRALTRSQTMHYIRAAHQAT